MKQLENSIGYHFKDEKLLELAVTHSSYTKENNLTRNYCNERLEFLGDAVLETIICQQLYERVPMAQEGHMTKIKSNIVRAQSLATVAKKIDLHEYLKLGNGEKFLKDRNKEGILADAVESIIAAVFIDGGFEKAKEVVLGLFEEQIKKGLSGELYDDFKSEFQEIVQQNGIHKIEYKVTKEEGKSHDKTFFVDLFLDGKFVGSGVGKSKKSAENQAAKCGISNIKEQ